MAHAQKPDFVFRRIGRVLLNRRGRQFIRLLAVEVCASVVVMLDTPCSEPQHPVYTQWRKKEAFFSNNCNFFYFEYKNIMLTPKQPVINAVLITYID